MDIADNGYFTFQMIIDIAGMHGTILDVGSPVIIIHLVIIIYKKVNKQATKKNLEFSTRVGTIAHQ